MSQLSPVVYILHGDDEFGITQFVQKLQNELGDSAFAEMNTTRLDGRSASFEELETAASSLPFLVDRRLVLFAHPLARLNTPQAQKRLIDLLERAPQTVMLVLIEYQGLEPKRGQKPPWLLRWGQEAKGRALVRAFPLPKGDQMAVRIQELAKMGGGQITLDAADLLASYCSESPRLADQELHKLLAYVNYSRPVEIDDVEQLSVDQGGGDVFALVDALGQRNSRLAMNMLHRLLAEQDPLFIFAMIVRQFRLLLLTREILEQRGNQEEIARQVRVPGFVAGKLIAQARQFPLPSLEAIYHHLLEIDRAAKSSEMELDVSLDALVATVTQPSG